MASSVGNVMRLPEPTIVLIVPAAMPAPRTASCSRPVTRGGAARPRGRSGGGAAVEGDPLVGHAACDGDGSLPRAGRVEVGVVLLEAVDGHGAGAPAGAGGEGHALVVEPTAVRRVLLVQGLGVEVRAFRRGVELVDGEGARGADVAGVEPDPLVDVAAGQDELVPPAGVGRV